MASTKGQTGYSLTESLTLDLGGENNVYVQNEDSAKKITVEFEKGGSNSQVILSNQGDAIRIFQAENVRITADSYPASIAYTTDNGANFKLEPAIDVVATVGTISTIDTVDNVGTITQINSITDVTNGWADGPGTTTALAASGSYTSAFFSSRGYGYLQGLLISDQSWSGNINFSIDGVNVDYQLPISGSAGTGVSLGYLMYAPYLQLEITNGSTAMTYLRAQTWFVRNS
jgi:hypothetical protein